MAAFKLSLQEVHDNPQDFLYVFASDDYIRRMGSKYALIIKQKRANQNKILLLCAQNAGVDVSEYYNSARQGFIDTYGITPAEILVKLANGDTVAGKNWSEGVFGVGALSDTFSQPTSDGFTVKVNTQDGSFIVNGQEFASGAIARKGCPDGYGGFSYVDGGGNTYFSSYSKTKKQYYAGTYTKADGTTYTSDGRATTAAGSSDIWETIIGFLDKLANWIISLFGGGSTKTISSANTSPNQMTDGYATTEAGFGSWGVALLASVAIGAVLFGEGLMPGKKKK